MDTSPVAKQPGQGNLSAVAGGVLVVMGGLLLAGQLAGRALWPSGGWLTWANAWPLLPIGIGLSAVLLSLAGDPEAGWLAAPGAVVTAVGLLLLFDRLTDQWQTWAYAWALAFPAATGVGLWLQGWRSGRTELVGRGRRLTALGLGIFAGLAAFFELGLNLSGVFAAGLAGYLLPALLIAAGAYLLLGTARRQGGIGSPR